MYSRRLPEHTPRSNIKASVMRGMRIFIRLFMHKPLSSINDFDYVLPEQLIAQFPTKNRIDSRLLIIPNNNTDFIHEKFRSILNYINPNDLIIFNDTRVIPARLFGVKKSGGKIECLIERVLNDHQALAHIRASHAPKIGCEIVLED